VSGVWFIKQRKKPFQGQYLGKHSTYHLRHNATHERTSTSTSRYRLLLSLSGYYIAIRLRFGFDSTTTKNEHVHFFVATRGVVANKKAAVGAYNDAVVYVTVTIRMAFTLTDEHWVASFDCRRWYSLFTHFRSNVVWYEFMPSLTYCHDAHFYESNWSRIEVKSKSNRNCNSRFNELL